MAGGPTRHFEDLIVGEARRSDEREVTLEEILRFAREHDPQWFHVDPEAAEGSVFGGVVASGIHTAAIWRRLDHAISGDIAWMCGVRWDDVVWAEALRPGDRIRAEYRIVAARASASSPDRGVARVRCAVVRSDGVTLLSFVSTNLVYTRAWAARRAA